ncbi:MAG TPA: hypothetical protein VF594_05920, partial [Rubricoccaceae bacterium]
LVSTMRKTLLFSLGAVVLAGCDFSGGSDAVAPISSLKAENLPAATGPSADLFFEVQDAVGRSYYRSAVQIGASTDSLETSVPASLEIPTATSPMYIAVFDYENSLLESRMLARSTAFTAAELTAAPLVLQDAPFRNTGDSEATFTVTRSNAVSAE